MSELSQIDASSAVASVCPDRVGNWCRRHGLPLNLKDSTTCPRCQTDPAFRALLARAGEQLRTGVAAPGRTTECSDWPACPFGGEPYETTDMGRRVRVRVCRRDPDPAPVPICECVKCTVPKTDIGPVLVVTCVYGACDLACRHGESVLAGAPDGKARYMVWDDFSTPGDARGLAAWCNGHGVALLAAGDYGLDRPGNYAKALNILLEKSGHDGHVLVSESDCMLPADWYRLYAALVSQAPADWGVVAGLTVDEAGRPELPDTHRVARQKLDIHAAVLTETDNTCLAGALVNRDAIRAGHWFRPNWRFLNCSVGLGNLLRSKGYRNFLSAGVPIVHYPHSSREQLHRDTHGGESRWTPARMADERAKYAQEAHHEKPIP